MSTRPIPRGHRSPSDRGSVLPLALILTLVLGVVAAAIAAYTATALRSTTVTSARVDRLADAEAGLRQALVELETSRDCPPIGDLSGDFNGSTATVAVTRCDRVAVESSESDRQYGLVLSGRFAEAFDGGNKSGETIKIGGDIFLGLNVNGTGEDIAATSDVYGQRVNCEGYTPEPLGWLLSAPQGPAPPPPPALPAATPICTESGWESASPPPGGLVLPTNDVTSSSMGSCRVYQPGVIDDLSTDNHSRSYLRSGVYVVTDRFRIRGNLTAGHPSGTTSIGAGSPNSACAAAQQQDVEDGGAGGVIFVLTGAGHFDFDNQADRIEFHGFPVGTRSISVAAFPPGVAGAPASTLGPTEPILVSAPTPKFTYFGEFWAPDAFVDLENLSSWQAGNGFRGGVTLARLEFKVTGGAPGGLIISVNTGPQIFRYRVEVTATDDRGGTTTVSAVTQLLEDGLILDSWRVH